jgi:uncharacterized protein YeaO (DUF488 family)
MNKIILNRGQMATRHTVPNPIDVTIKSAKQPFKQLAPSWGMVMGYKAGTMSDATYTELYRNILAKVAWDPIIKYLRQYDHVTFMCYCQDGEFCHTHLLIDYMTSHFGTSVIDGRPLQQL